jgi:hypothetical protein
MAEAVYILCILTSLACAVLLLHGYRQNGVRLLLWSGLCFVGLSLNNALVFIDLVMVPAIDLSILRPTAALLGLSALLYGLIWDAE